MPRPLGDFLRPCVLVFLDKALSVLIQRTAGDNARLRMPFGHQPVNIDRWFDFFEKNASAYQVFKVFLGLSQMVVGLGAIGVCPRDSQKAEWVFPDEAADLVLGDHVVGDA